MSTEADIVERLRDRSLELSGRSIDRGCQDSGMSANLCDEAVDLITKLRAERDDLKADYLRRHNDACDYWLVLKRIADGYGPDHLSKACRDWAQFAIDEAHRRTDTVIATEGKSP